LSSATAGSACPELEGKGGLPNGLPELDDPDVSDAAEENDCDEPVESNFSGRKTADTSTKSLNKSSEFLRNYS
jgi:hypothetical protein